MFKLHGILAAICLSFIALTASAAEVLNIGDPAPPLTVASFVKGNKIDKLDPKKTYVVEFWATWCGPCKASIPHLTELAHKYKDKGVQFIGVDVWENDTKGVQPFVDEMGEKMDYNVALDKVAADADPSDGAMAKNWLTAADENGIPTAFVIQNGKIAWIGHPMKLEDALAKITAGDWDLAKMAKQRLADKEKQRKLAEAEPKILTPYNAKNYPATLAAIDEVTKTDPDLAEDFASIKFVALANAGQIDAALKLGEQLYANSQDKPDDLNNTFFDAIDPDRVDQVDPRIAKLVLKAIRRAVELTKGEQPEYLDSLAEAQYRTGDTAGALATSQKSAELFKARYKTPPPQLLEFLNQRQERYRQPSPGDSTAKPAGKN